MITKRQLKAKTKELIKNSTKHMVENIDKAIASGAIDLNSYEDNYILPKILLCALLKEEMHQYKPLGDDRKKTMQKEIDNIYSLL